SFWSDSTVRFTVPALMHSGPVQIVVNGLYSNGVPFEFALGSRDSAQAVYIVPDEMKLAVGQSRALTLVDGQGAPASGVTWSIDSTSVAEITYDTAPDTGAHFNYALLGLR